MDVRTSLFKSKTSKAVRFVEREPQTFSLCSCRDGEKPKRRCVKCGVWCMSFSPFLSCQSELSVFSRLQMGSVSKHQAIVKDRISALPDAVLGHILSFLRTKYAVRTTILSKRWNKLWTYVPSLDFKDEQDFRTDGYGSELFTNFVDRVLLFRQSSDIRKFRLSLRHCEAFSRIDGWICTAIRRNVVELDFFLCVDDVITFELPRCVFMCKTLEVLKLASNCLTCAPPPSGCFSSLKFLHVSVYYPVSDWVANIFSHCPVLEGLIIDGNVGLERVLNFNISARNLKTLKIDLYIDGNPGDPAYNLFIDAPKLEILDVKLDQLSNYYIEDAKSLIKADIDLKACTPCSAELQPAFANRVTALLALISSVKYLSLSAHCMEYFIKEEGDVDMKLLALHECYCWEWLPVLLEALHNLESLALQDLWCTCAEAGLPKKESLDMEDGVSEDKTEWNRKYSQHQWNPPEFVPVCLSSHLKSVFIRGFKGRPVEIEVAKYLLKNGKVLSKLAIHTCPHTKPEELHKEFVTFQRCSTTCQVELL